MFVQVIQGRATDAMGLRKQLERWNEELRPGAEGYLGTTAGVTEDNEFIAGARFESEEAARRNSDRPEQGAWWEETAQCIVGDVRFADCADVDTLGARAGSDDAGFVQVIQGRGDRQAMLAAAKGLEGFFARLRPDVLGTYVAWEDDERFSQLVYFTSEAEAREGEQRCGIVMSAVQFDRFIDLPEPWFASA